MLNKNSWIPHSEDTHFSIHNLPFGIFSVGSNQKRVGIAIGEQIVDMAVVSALELFKDQPIDQQVFKEDTLNSFIALGKPITNEVRIKVQNWLMEDQSPLKEHEHILIDQSAATLHMPIHIGDYTDFYSSLEHATNVGKMFRGPENPLLPNWKHLPVGYHGRASSIVESGIPIHRPTGQVLPKEASSPEFHASSQLDFELEMAFVIGKENRLGQPVSLADAENHIFGMVLFNDWSARDIQKWEYVPLGPFLGKSFASSISPWIVTMEALDPFRVKGPVQEPQVLPYLQFQGPYNFDIGLKVSLTPPEGNDNILCTTNFKHMYWNMAQQLAHHTVNGCNLRVGDLMASGTISGPEPKNYGSMLELSWGGTKPIILDDGMERTFVENYDTITLYGLAEKPGIKVGFGETRTKILPTIYG